MKNFVLSVLCLGLWQCSQPETEYLTPVPDPVDHTKDSAVIAIPTLITAPNASGLDVASDAANNIYVVGSYSGTAAFGNTAQTSVGATDMYLAKYNGAGIFQWVRSIGGAGYDEARSVVVDGSGNVYLTGDFDKTISVGNHTLTTRGSQDILIAKFDSDGKALWTQSAGSSGGERGFDIAVDGNGNAYVTGEFQGTGEFGNVTRQSAGEFDVFVAKYGSDGSFQWVQTEGGSQRDTGRGIAADPRTGDVYVTGYYFGTTKFGDVTRTSAGDADGFFTKYSTEGVLQWMHTIGGTGADAGNDIAIGAGSIYVTGQNSDPVDYSQSGGRVTGSGVSGFLARYKPDGVIQWGNDLVFDADGMGVAADQLGNAYVVNSRSTIVRYTAEGLARQEQSPQGDLTGWGVTVNPNNKLYVTGYYKGTLTFGAASKTDPGWLNMYIVGGDIGK